MSKYVNKVQTIINITYYCKIFDLPMIKPNTTGVENCQNTKAQLFRLLYIVVYLFSRNNSTLEPYGESLKIWSFKNMSWVYWTV